MALIPLKLPPGVYKNGTEFETLKHHNLRGYKRRDFSWDENDLRNALEQGIDL